MQQFVIRHMLLLINNLFKVCVCSYNIAYCIAIRLAMVLSKASLAGRIFVRDAEQTLLMEQEQRDETDRQPNKGEDVVIEAETEIYREEMA